MAITKFSASNTVKTSSAGKYGPSGTNIVEFFAIPYTNSAAQEQYFTVPDGVTKITAIMWGAGGSSYYDGTQSGYGGSGGFTQATFNVLEKELTIVVGGATMANSYTQGGYGAGGNGANGGSAGGGASLIISGRKSGLYNYTTGVSTGGALFTPTSTLTSLAGATDIILVAGGGGGAGWYGTNTGNLHGGSGGGIFGASGATQNGTAGGGTQTSGGAAGGARSAAGGFLFGGYSLTNESGGGQGGGGSGWYGGGAGGHASGNNGGGGGGSSFCGYADGSLSTVLTANQADGYSYINTSVRTNGLRKYFETYMFRNGTTGTPTPGYTGGQPNIATNVWTDGVGTGGSPSRFTTFGNGKVVLVY